MNSSPNEEYQRGSLRIRVSGGTIYELVRYNGKSWDVVPNNSDRALQQAMRAAVPGQEPGLYVPTPEVGLSATPFPPIAA